MSTTEDLNILGLKALRVIAVVIPLSLVIFTHGRELTPLYGSGPTSYLLDKIAFGAVLASAIHPIRVSLKRNLLYTALTLTLAPNATYWVAVWTSRNKDPVLGPAITHATVLGPLAFLLTTFIVEMDQDTEVKSTSVSQRPELIIRLLRASITHLISSALAKRLWSSTAFFYRISDNQIYLTLAGLAFNLSIISFQDNTQFNTTKNASKKNRNGKKNAHATAFGNSQMNAALLVAFNALWWMIYPLFGNPILPHPLSKTYVHPTYPLNILSAEQSVTGLITVGQWLPPPDYKGENDQQLHSARYIRADHSILGGVWTHDKVQVLDDEPPLTDSFGVPLGDSIYSTFVLQEAVRLVNSTATAGKWNNALIIGLGAGISGTAFMRHGISTTIVEIDPAVYKAARTYFGLPDPGTGKVFLEDARKWTAKKRASIESGNKETLYDIVVHDCFSGGGVPEHIFTFQFWNDLKTVMQPEGVLVVNFAGSVGSMSSRLVINTLERNFGQSCRAFHDLFEDLTPEKYDTEFINVVIFCTRSPSPLTFRKTRRSDWLGSPLRRHILQSLENREVNLTSIRSPPGDMRYILTDHQNPLGALQKKQANHYWEVMRDVLPNVHWETY